MLIELRVRSGDYKLRSVLKAVKANHLVYRGKVHTVPHLSLYGNARVSSDDLPELRARVAKVCRKYQSLPYLIDGYDPHVSHKGKVVAFRIIPSPELRSFRDELVRSLRKDFPSEKPWDNSDDSDPWFHIAVAYNLPDDEFDRVWEYLKESGPKRTSESLQPGHVRKVKPYLPLEGLRVTILGEARRIDREYDLTLGQFLTRDEALDWRGWCRTLRAFRTETGIELKKPGLLQRFTRRSQKAELFFISDLHLDHRNVIKYCARPFCRDVREMNRVLINNWNFTVRDIDKVYFLGDLTFGRGHKSSSYWWPKLNGEKSFVKGNHDDNAVASIPYDR